MSLQRVLWSLAEPVELGLEQTKGALMTLWRCLMLIQAMTLCAASCLGADRHKLEVGL